MRRVIIILLTMIFMLEVVFVQQMASASEFHEKDHPELISGCCETEPISCCEASAIEVQKETNSSNCCGEEEGPCKHPCCQTPLSAQYHLLLFNCFSVVDFHTHPACLDKMNYSELTCSLPHGIQADSWRPPRHI